MNTTILTVVAGALLAGQSAPNWNADYSQAQQLGAQQKKPLAVVFGMGANGWQKVVRDGAPTPAATELLSEKYVCVYIDMTTKAGRNLAQSFEIKTDTGLVISDRTGTLQAFWHQGDMTGQLFAGTLKRYSDVQGPVRSTDTGTISRTSFYPSLNSEGSTGSVLQGDSSYCPGCNRAPSRSRR